MIRLIKWKYEDFEVVELLPSSFYIGFGKFAFMLVKYRGGLSMSVSLKYSMFEIQFISKKKRPDLVDFSGYGDTQYLEVGNG